MRVITVELPFPPSALRPNARRHPGTNRIGREYGQAVWLALREQLGPPGEGGPLLRAARLDITAIYPSGRGVWDDDAVVAAIKRGRDQFRTYNLIPDDSPRYLTLGSVTAQIDRTRRVPVLIVTLTETAPGAIGPPLRPAPEISL